MSFYSDDLRVQVVLGFKTMKAWILEPFVNIFKGFVHPLCSCTLFFKTVQCVATVVNISEASLITPSWTTFQFWCTYARTLLKHGQIVTPGAFYARAWVDFTTNLFSLVHLCQYFVHVWKNSYPWCVYARPWVNSTTTLLCRDLFSLDMFGLLYTPG